MKVPSLLPSSIQFFSLDKTTANSLDFITSAFLLSIYLYEYVYVYVKVSFMYTYTHMKA